MTLDDFVRDGWAAHADDAAGVMARFDEGLALVTEAQHLPALAHLVAHVSGEHLGRFDEGVALLTRLEASPVFDAADASGKAVRRQMAALHLCAGRTEESERCLAAALTGGDVPEASDRIRVLAVAAPAFLHQGRTDDAARALDECLRLAEYGPSREDPAARALAATGNNMAVEVETMASRGDAERALMLRAAETALRFWTVAGTWREQERAEYRLAMSRLAADDAPGALRSARSCLTIVEANGSEPGEAFFAREALAKARLALREFGGARRERDAAAALLPSIADESFRTYCAAELAKLDAVIPPRPGPRRSGEPSILRSAWK